MLDRILTRGQVQLRLEKPRAIVWAEAPAVEVIRQIPGGNQSVTTPPTPVPFDAEAATSDDSWERVGALKNAMKRGAEPQNIRGLLVIKPYVRS